MQHLPYSHSLLVGLGLGAVLWALLRWFFRRPQLAAVFGWVAASHSASPMADNPFILPTTILITILLAWGLIHRYATAATTDRAADAELVPSVTGRAGNSSRAGTTATAPAPVPRERRLSCRSADDDRAG